MRLLMKRLLLMPSYFIADSKYNSVMKGEIHETMVKYEPWDGKRSPWDYGWMWPWDYGGGYKEITRKTIFETNLRRTMK